MSGSRWVRLDVDYFRNPKVLAAGRDGRDLHLASICWSGSQDHLDGLIPDASVRTLLADAGVTRKAISLAVEAGLWVPNGCGYVLHDWRPLNGSESEAEHRRVAWRERQAAYRARRRGETQGETDA